MMAGAVDAMAGLLHVAFCRCRAKIEVFEDQCFQNIGAPFEEPLADSFMSVKILGLHKDWWANLTALAQVCTECMKVARVMPGWALLASISIGVYGAQPKQGLGRGRTVGSGAEHTLAGIDSIHRSVVGSLYPRKIKLPLKITPHFLLLKTTLHPSLHKGQIPIRDLIVKDWMMCPVSTVGRPGMLMSQMFINITFFPSGKLIM
jgi:hypothetical protein